MLLRDEVYITQLDIYVRNTTKHAINIPNLYKVMYRIRLFVTEYFVVFQFAKRFPMGNYIIVDTSPKYIRICFNTDYYDNFIELIFTGVLRDM